MSEEPQTSALKLGEDNLLVEIDTRETLAWHTLSMAQQCSRHLDIVSRHLDPQLYDTDDFSAAVKRLALSRRRARVRIMVIDARPLVSKGHRLIDLCNRLPSFVEMRAPGRQHRSYNQAVMLVDGHGYIHRQFSDRFEAQANFADRRVASSMGDRFEDMWERGVPETRFRRLHI
jgi:hypothetical protein